MGKPRRVKTVLVVDDYEKWRRWTTTIAHENGLRTVTASRPAEAMKIIDRKMRAIVKVRAKLTAELTRTRNPKRKKEISSKLRALSRAEKGPFDLVVSDINMPDSHPIGKPFIGSLKRKFPKQKIVISSDDYDVARAIQEKHSTAKNKIPFVDKRDHTHREQLAHWIRRQTGRSKKS